MTSFVDESSQNSTPSNEGYFVGSFTINWCNTPINEDTVVNHNTFDSVAEYARAELNKLAVRLGLTQDQIDMLQFLFTQSLQCSAEILAKHANDPYVPANKEAREFLDFLEKLIVGEESRLIGEENLAQALEFMQEGGNVLLVQNHTSGADTIVMDYLVNKLFNNAAKSWTYMAGHVVNLFLLPLTICGGLSRIPIFSAKYCQHASPEILADMKAQNANAMGQLAPLVSKGGVLIGLYPEGGRGEGALKAGEVRTMKIPQLLSMASPRGLMILPSYVSGATSILPVVRSEREFEEFITHVRRGNANVEFGRGVMWDDLQPTHDTLLAYLGEDCCVGLTPDQALKHFLTDQVMGLIAKMAPTEAAKGPYGKVVK